MAQHVRLGPAVETDVALPLQGRKTVRLGPALETDFALPLRAIVASAPGVVAEVRAADFCTMTERATVERIPAEGRTATAADYARVLIPPTTGMPVFAVVTAWTDPAPGVSTGSPSCS